MYGELQVLLHAFWTLTLLGADRYSSTCGPFTAETESRCRLAKEAMWIVDRVEAVEMRLILLLLGVEADTSTVQLVVQWLYERLYLVESCVTEAGRDCKLVRGSCGCVGGNPAAFTPTPACSYSTVSNTHLIAEGNYELLAVSLRTRETTCIKFIKRHHENDVLWGVTSCSVIESCRRFEET